MLALQVEVEMKGVSEVPSEVLAVLAAAAATQFGSNLFVSAFAFLFAPGAIGSSSPD